MEKIKISSEKYAVLPKEAIDLWSKLGWGCKKDYQEESIKNALKNTSFIVSARNKNNDLVGLARVLSDGVINTTVADIVVDPEYQGKGVGTKMMEKIKEKYKNTGIYLEAFKENSFFFEECGYIKRNNMKVFSKKFN